MPAPSKILDLIHRFRDNLSDYRSGRYNETQLRREFLDPFFEALGWDVNNAQGYAEAYKDVVHEDAVKVGGATKAPDYGFRIGGTRKFFVEAKKPSVNLKDDISPAFQLRRYAWSAKLPLSILTDFEEFAVYDCRVKPDKSDKAGTARVMYFTFEQYADKWEEIASVFSREAVLKGSFDRYAEAATGKRGTQEVDEVFLAEIERWRELLARNIALRNPGLSVRDLNYAVQLTIDRLVFLRIGEDRGFEPYERLRQIASGKEVYARLLDVFGEADARYNSGLFHLKAEKGRENPDTLTPRLVIDDKVFKDILTHLYYPDSPYDFNVMPADILGQVYEQFLGKVIRLTKGGRAEVEDKPEVKKAGGVYYTPTYIVAYIVQHTVGKLLEGKTPDEVAVLKICDPACGSGSFLLGAYQFLLDWHLAWYTAHNPEKWARGKEPHLTPGPSPKEGRGEWRLTTAEKRRILLNNLYGVDIDPQAVEVTKLSLLLKVLEGENEGSLRQLAMFHERVLPDLNQNIKCGNSLIGSDFYEGGQFGGQLGMFDLEESYRINAFDWAAEFPGIFQRQAAKMEDAKEAKYSLTAKGGGFDAVIGNPPYIRIQTMETQDISYFSKKYKSAIGNYDIYCLFLEKAMSLITKGGFVSFILPHRFFKTDYGLGLRKLLVDKSNLVEIVDFDGYMVFAKASINTCIIVLTSDTEETYKYSQLKFTKSNDQEMIAVLQAVENNQESNIEEMIVGQLPIKHLSEEPWVFIFPNEQPLWDKLNLCDDRLKDVTTQIFQGLKTGSDSIFSVDTISEEKERTLILCKFDNKEYWIENDLIYPQIKGGEMKRFHIRGTNRIVIFPYRKGKLLDAKTLQEKFPLTWEYFKTHQKYLENREGGKMKGEGWYAYTRSQALTSMEQPKIVTPDYYAHASYALDENGRYFFFGGGAGGYGIVLKPEYKNFFVIGLLNSKLLDWYLRKISVRQYQTAFSYVKKYIEQLPIRPINFSDPADVARHDHMVALVQSMLDLHKQLAAAHTPTEKTMLQRQITATDRQIDKLVYELYGLTKEEIGIVEG